MARLAALLLVIPGVLAAQSSGVSGTVRWQGHPLAQALVEAVHDDSVLARTRTNEAGQYRLTARPGEITVRVRQAGFEERRLTGVRVAPGAMTTVDAELTYHPVPLSQIVVAVSRRAESTIDAPASTAVVDEREIRERNTVSPLDHVVNLAGVDVAMQGLQARQVVARGFNGVFGTSLLLLSDSRDVSIPSLRGNLGTFVTPANDDLERVEVVRGPASALYGPNAADGVVHFVTKSPFDSPGTSLSMTGGGRSLFEGSARVARVASERLALRVSGTYVRGREWDAPPAPSEVVKRDPGIERLNAEGRADFRVTQTGTAVLSLGSTFAMKNVEYTTIGTTQVKDWRTSFAQLRYSDGRFSAQAYANFNEAGNSTLLQTGDTIVDHSRFIAAQVQHGFERGRVAVTYGADLQRTNPITEGTIDGRFENDDASLQTGAYVQGETSLSTSLKVLGAVRADRHDRMKGVVWSPRLGLMYTPRAGQALRLTFNRAFSTPTSPELFIDLVAAKLDPLPYSLRALGVPKDGLRFQARCAGGPCMSSPFAPGAPLPLDATKLWPAVVAILKGAGVDISGLPAPATADVATVLRTLDLTTGSFRTHAGAVPDVSPLAPTLTSAMELGYKGLLGERLLFDASVYYTRRRDFIAPLSVVTPNVFLSTADLTRYLTRFMPADQAAGLAAGIGGVDGNAKAPGIPLGTVGPDGALGGTDLLMTYANFGEANLWGGDGSVEYAASPRVSLTAGYSYTSRVYFPAKRSGESDLSMNAPRNKAVAGATWRNPGNDLSASLRGRYVGAFKMLNGVWSGDVPSFTVVDVEAGVSLPSVSAARVTLTVQNVADKRHAEFFGAPVLGRLAMLRLHYRF